MIFIQLKNYILLVLFYLLLTACASFNADYHSNGFALAQQAGFTDKLIQTQAFDLTAFTRIQNNHQPIRVYIEGDGFAWVNKQQQSSDPTPHQALALQLASIDPYPNIIYMARPCQYQQTNRACDTHYWGDKRFAIEVIKSMQQALDALNINHSAIELVGYSGGGAIAILMAADRTDVLNIRTIAANLDHIYVNQFHHVALMPDSLNAIDFAQKNSKITQIHFIGLQDTVIPPETAKRYLKKSKSSSIRLVEVQAGHQFGWLEKWLELLAY